MLIRVLLLHGVKFGHFEFINLSCVPVALSIFILRKGSFINFSLCSVFSASIFATYDHFSPVNSFEGAKYFHKIKMLMIDNISRLQVTSVLCIGGGIVFYFCREILILRFARDNKPRLAETSHH